MDAGLRRTNTHSFYIRTAVTRALAGNFRSRRGMRLRGAPLQRRWSAVHRERGMRRAVSASVRVARLGRRARRPLPAAGPCPRASVVKQYEFSFNEDLSINEIRILHPSTASVQGRGARRRRLTLVRVQPRMPPEIRSSPRPGGSLRKRASPRGSRDSRGFEALVSPTHLPRPPAKWRDFKSGRQVFIGLNINIDSYFRFSHRNGRILMRAIKGAAGRRSAVWRAPPEGAGAVKTDCPLPFRMGARRRHPVPFRARTATKRRRCSKP